MKARLVRPTTDLEIALIQANRQRGSAMLALVLDGVEGLLENARAAPDRATRAQAAAAIRRFVGLLEDARTIAAIVELAVGNVGEPDGDELRAVQAQAIAYAVGSSK